MRFPRLHIAVTLVLAGCAVGPDYEPVDAGLPEKFTHAEDLGDPDATPIKGLWTSLGNPELTRLIDLALENNTTILQALATLNETRALSGLAVYSLLPTVGVSGEFERSRFSNDDPFAFPGLGVVERYRAGFDATWEIDLFGSLRRQAEAFEYLVEADEATVYAVELSIVAEVAQTYFQWQGETLRLEILQSNLENQADNLRILEVSLEAGRGTAFDVARAKAVERQIAAAVPVAEAAIDRAEQRLSVLTRMPVDELLAELGPPSALPKLPPLVAVGTPAEWLARRPDVWAAERRLASAPPDPRVSTAE